MNGFGFAGAPFEIKFLDEAKATPGSFEGYAAFFKNMDSHGDVIEPGAFANSLLERKREGRRLPPMYKQHGMANGRDPVGVWDEIEEDANGLYAKGRIIGLDTEAGKFTYAQARDGALAGLSIGYRVAPNGSRAGSGRVGEPKRYLKALHLGEVSLVGDPSNARAALHSIKSMIGAGDFADEIKTIRDFEQFLRDAGWSNAAAKAIATSGFKATPDPRDEDGIKAALAGAFTDLAKLIHT